MSGLSVNRTIRVIETKPEIKPEDFKQVEVAAERSDKGRPDGVTNVEAREIQDFVAKNKKKILGPTMNAVNAFMMRHNLPYEANREPMRAQMKEVLAKLGDNLGEPLLRKPRTGSLNPVRLSAEGEPLKSAYYDVVKKQFVVKVEDKFYGPFPYNPPTT